MKTTLFATASAILWIVAALAFWSWYTTRVGYWIDLSALIALLQWIAIRAVNRYQQKSKVQG